MKPRTEEFFSIFLPLRPPLTQMLCSLPFSQKSRYIISLNTLRAGDADLRF